MLSHPIVLTIGLTLLILVASMIVFKEWRYQKRQNQAAAEAEKRLQEKLGRLKRLLDDNPDIDLECAEVQTLAREELRLLEAWLAGRPEQAPYYRGRISQLKRILALSKPSD